MSVQFKNPNTTAWFGPVVNTEYGLVEGSTHFFGFTDNVDKFFGIPFAAPPTDENRLKPPQPYTKKWSPWIRQVDTVPNICPQGNSTNEDCLYLNVYRPTGASSKSNLPVFFWIYGGAYSGGDSYSGGLYDGANLVNKFGQVVVTVNYRLNGLGFFALPELVQEDEHGTTGNYGCQDQRAALQWVQRNIRNFGGDPSRVTIVGESAGAFSVQWHLVSPASRDLFHAAIMQSGTSHLDFVFQNQAEAFEFYSDLAQGMGCPPGNSRLNCLRNLPAASYIESIGFILELMVDKLAHLPLPQIAPALASPLFPIMPFGPVVDNTSVGLPENPLEMVRKGDHAKVPLMLGSNKDGGAYFGPILPLLWGDWPLFQYDVNEFAKWFFTRPDDQAAFVRLYGTGEFGGKNIKNMDRFDRAFRDMLFTCSNREIAELWSKSNLSTYAYMFSFDFGGLIGTFLGDGHGFEIPFVFRNRVWELGALTDLDIFGKKYGRMSDIMSATWASFISCQSPRCTSPPPNTGVLDGLPEWPRFNANRPFYSMRLDPVVEHMNSTTFYPNDEFPGDDRCDFWAQAELNLVDWKKARNSYVGKHLETILV